MVGHESISSVLPRRPIKPQAQMSFNPQTLTVSKHFSSIQTALQSFDSKTNKRPLVGPKLASKQRVSFFPIKSGWMPRGFLCSSNRNVQQWFQDSQSPKRSISKRERQHTERGRRDLSTASWNPKALGFGNTKEPGGNFTLPNAGDGRFVFFPTSPRIDAKLSSRSPSSMRKPERRRGASQI